MIEKLKGIEKEMFSNVEVRDKAINYIILGGLEFDYLDKTSQRFYKNDCTLNEVNFCLDLYLDFVKKGKEKIHSKRLALLETIHFIYDRDYPFYWEIW